MELIELRKQKESLEKDLTERLNKFFMETSVNPEEILLDFILVSALGGDKPKRLVGIKAKISLTV